MRDVDPLDLVETIREGVLVLKPDLTIRFANRSFCHTFAVAPEHAVGRKLHAHVTQSAETDHANFLAVANSPVAHGRVCRDPGAE